MSTKAATSSSQEARNTNLFVGRGVVAIAWAVVFAVAAKSLTSGVTVGAAALLVIYPLIDLVASLIDARSQDVSTRPLLANAAVSAVAAVALGVAATGTVADVLAVFGIWAGVTGAAQLVVVLRRRAQFGHQWPLCSLTACPSSAASPSSWQRSLPTTRS